MKVVSDSTPLISLARIGQLDLLREMFGEILVPSAVYDEVVVGGRGLTGAIEVAGATWIRTLDAPTASDPQLRLQTSRMGAGEIEAIRVAIKLDAELLLLDEVRARREAALHGLAVTGTLGVLEKAYEKKMIKNLGQCFRDLLKAGIWYEPQLLSKILDRSGGDAT